MRRVLLVLTIALCVGIAGCVYLDRELAPSALRQTSIGPTSLGTNAEEVIGILREIAQLHEHGTTHNNLTTAQIVARLESDQAVECYCGYIALATIDILEDEGYTCRLVAMNSPDDCFGHTMFEVQIDGVWCYADITFDVFPMDVDETWMSLIEFSDALAGEERIWLELLDATPEMGLSYLTEAALVPMHLDGDTWYYPRAAAESHMDSCKGGNDWQYMEEATWLYEFYGIGSPTEWDLLDEDFDSVTWSDEDYGNGVSEESPSGQLRLDGNSEQYPSSNWARRSTDLGDLPDSFEVEIEVYHDALGTIADCDAFSLLLMQSDEGLFVLFSTAGLFVYDSDSGYTEVGTDLVEIAEWQTWRFVVEFSTSGDGTCDVYLEDQQVGSSIPCSFESTSFENGYVWVDQGGYTTDDRVTHVDWVRAKETEE